MKQILKKQWMAVLLFVLAEATLSGCRVLYHVERTPDSRETFYLTPAQRSLLENLAIEKSDAKAAYDLAFYYELSAYDDKHAYKWFKIAKKLSDDPADDWIKTRADDWIKTIERAAKLPKMKAKPDPGRPVNW